MNFIRGGELFKHLCDAKRFTHERAQFYAAQVALALGHLHKKKILYRDLKPENILLASDGYIFLADFGLAKILERNEMAESFCGTAEYLSPEMVEGTGHDQGIDWWALGILMYGIFNNRYEMIVGIPPFYHKNKHKMYYLIQNAPIRFPDPDKHGIEVGPEAQDIINKLLNKDKHLRLGMKTGISEIIHHPFFNGLDITKLILKELEAPFKPDVGQENDVCHFDPKLTTQEVKETLLDDCQIKLIDENKDMFNDF